MAILEGASSWCCSRTHLIWIIFTRARRFSELNYCLLKPISVKATTKYFPYTILWFIFCKLQRSVITASAWVVDSKALIISEPMSMVIVSVSWLLLFTKCSAFKFIKSPGLFYSWCVKITFHNLCEGNFGLLFGVSIFVWDNRVENATLKCF